MAGGFIYSEDKISFKHYFKKTIEVVAYVM